MRANSFDAQVKADASKISDDYASIVALSVRQAFGSTEITLSKNGDGSFNTSDVMMFMKGALRYFPCMIETESDYRLFSEISSSGVRFVFSFKVTEHSFDESNTGGEHRGRDFPRMAAVPVHERGPWKAAIAPST